ncbi:MULTISPECIES: TIGR02757 family protein [unclassified Arenibacter]|jgi:uncharacterized protein (TIGR02757 family)|uniref:TIGR02757 family protein n=1 Tax=unclassified Arenibacter TaxID=2615047 RepID=UPI000E3466DC|nr:MULTISPECIES: TIGR02757 family protein [unclassified Arenibacter]MCM4163088.1 TIGR02757 family protein [Arenibacter sp. A80]RFT57121.1 TIGR02757 family protein [Arenibacter sp. P308M17]
MTQEELKEFLDAKVAQYNRPDFLSTDPLQIPHGFTKKEDIEISGFLTATIAWGNRKSIINNAGRMMELLENSPFDFVMNHGANDLEILQEFVHRTFNGADLTYFIRSLNNIYNRHGGLENTFALRGDINSMPMSISNFKRIFFELDHQPRTTKHVSDPQKGSAAKRINMFLRWMVRNDGNGVDFGIWDRVLPSQLSCPLDVHSGNVARKLGLIQRRQNDAKALAELDANLRKLDPSDPVKYDFALFGLGVFEGF